MVQDSVLKSFALLRTRNASLRIAACEDFSSGAAHYNPCADSSPKMHKCMPRALHSAARAFHQNIRTEPLRLFSKAGATPRAMASGDRSSLWTFIDARNVRFARSLLRPALLQAQNFIVHYTERISAHRFVCCAAQ